MSNLYGEILLWGGEFNEKTVATLEQLGFLPCDGRLADARKYKLLYDVIGDKFRVGDEATPGFFRLPDLQGRVAVGAGKGDGLTERKPGETFGTEAHRLTVQEMPKHSHAVPGWRGNDGNRSGHQDSLYGQTDSGTQQAGGDLPHNNMQPSIVLNFVIRHRL